ncbi:hypothetical protein [Novosphingobium naphthalenivorans]|uniref:hypothetical protein n=1 Tax=Novosphingobium naphthalenivorans TaxID=273168 RepID=UPI0008321D03|nr:hypothetical protein [Novosphingobium naphthalenivorans]
MSDAAIPPSFDLAPIDDAARDGRSQLVFGGEYFALARFFDSAWRFPNGIELDFIPTNYRPQVHHG